MLPIGLDGCILLGEAHVGAHQRAVVAVEVAFGHLHDVLTGDVLQALVVFEPLLIAAARQFEALQQHGDAAVALHLLFAVHQVVHLDALQQFVAEAALLHAVEGGPDEFLGGFVLLAEQLGDVEDDVGAGVLQGEGDEAGGHQLALGGQLVQAAVTAGQDTAHHLQRQLVLVVGFHAGEDHQAHLDGGLLHLLDHLLLKRGQLPLWLLHGPAFGPAAEVFLGHLLRLLHVEVAHQDERHVRGHVVFVIEALHGRGLRVLQVTVPADDVAAVGVLAEALGEDVAAEGVGHFVGVEVALLVDGFQLALEEAVDGVAEALGIHLHPILQLVAGQDVVVDGVVVVGAGVEARATHLLQDGVGLVGNGVLRGLDVQTVDFQLYVVPLLVACGVVQTVVGLADAVQVALLRLPIGGADAVGALEHHVLEVVGHAGGGGVLVLRARVHHHGTIDFRLRMVLTNNHLQTVVKVEGLHVQLLLRRCSEAQRQREQK